MLLNSRYSDIKIQDFNDLFEIKLTTLKIIRDKIIFYIFNEIRIKLK
jgi:hypothetical protein